METTWTKSVNSSFPKAFRHLPSVSWYATQRWRAHCTIKSFRVCFGTSVFRTGGSDFEMVGFMVHPERSRPESPPGDRAKCRFRGCVFHRFIIALRPACGSKAQVASRILRCSQSSSKLHSRMDSVHAKEWRRKSGRPVTGPPTAISPRLQRRPDCFPNPARTPQRAPIATVLTQTIREGPPNWNRAKPVFSASGNVLRREALNVGFPHGFS